jgi:hypothetical protein
MIGTGEEREKHEVSGDQVYCDKCWEKVKAYLNDMA